MAKRIKYTGIQDRWPELSITGKQSVWHLGQQEDRVDAEAAMLLATGFFSAVQEQSSTGGAIVATMIGTFAVDGTITATLPPGVTGTLQFTKTLKASPFTKSNIAGAVANGVNTLSYVCLAADIPYNIGIDVSSAVSSTLGGAVSASAPGAPTIGTATGITGGATVAFSAPASDGGAAITTYTAYALGSNGNVVGTGSSATSPVTVPGLPDGTYTFKVAATNSAGLTGALSAASNSVTLNSSAVAPAFTSAPAITSAVLDNPIAFTSGGITGSPTPTVESQLMYLGMPVPASTVLTEIDRVNNNANINHINVRQIATNASGSAARMGVALRPTTGTSDPRWTSRPFMKGVPQDGRPVLMGGLANAGTATLTISTKVCVSVTELAEGRIDLATSNAATTAAGGVTGATTQTTCIYTAATGDVDKFAYPISAVTNGLGTIYYRGKGHKVRAAGVATDVLRVATAGANKPADGVFTNSGAVPLAMFQYVETIVGSANWSKLKLVLANRYIGAAQADLATGNAVTILSAYACYLNAASGNCPAIQVSAAFPALADGAFDVVTDDMLAAAFGKTELMQGDRITMKIEISIPVGAKVPIVSAGDNPVTSQAWIYDPAVTTITNKNNGTASSFTGTAPVTTILGQVIGEGFPFMVVGTQVSGDAPTDIGVADSIFYNSVGRSMFVASHYLCEDFGMPAIAGVNASRIGATNALFDNSAYLKSMVKYANRAILELGTNSVGATNLGNSTVLQNQDTATVALIRANAAPTVAGIEPLTVVRTRLLMAFAANNADSSQYSAVSPATQTPSARWALGGDLAVHYHPWCQSQVGTLFDRYIDYSLPLRLHPDPTHTDHYRAQPGTYSYEASGVLHPSPLGGYHAGYTMRQQLA